MAGAEDLINFDVIETQKENIQSLPGGRSARALASIFSPPPQGKQSNTNPSDTRSINDSIREEFEQELLLIAESDDPLDIYDRYVKWTLDAYPSAQATPQSQLLPLLERATKAFLASPHYKNDPRYLKLWLHYIRLFSDSPRETFAFLARHGIGESLALFYEEFAAWLERAGRWTQAEEVFTLGIEREARPAERLLRKFGEFQRRFESRPQNDNEPSSPALPTVRPALAAKIDPFASTAPGPVDPQAGQPPALSSGSSRPKASRQKMTIFSDGDAPAPVTSEVGAKGWENIGTLAHRKKENVMEPRPWAGETLKAGRRNPGVPKMPIFRDESESQAQLHTQNVLPPAPSSQQETINPRTGKIERVFVNLEAVYPNRDDPAEEYCFDELRALHRGWLSVDWRAENLKLAEQEMHEAEQEMREAEQNQTVSEADLAPIEEPEPPASVEKENIEVFRDIGAQEEQDERIQQESHKPKVLEVKGETQTIRTNLDSPTKSKPKRKVNAEPTMTLHTKAATDEIYSMFNQPLKSAKVDEEEDNSADDTSDGDDDDDDYTSAGESTFTGRTFTRSEAGDDDHDDEEDNNDAESNADNESDGEDATAWSDFTASKHVPMTNEEEASEQDENGDEEARSEPDSVREDDTNDSIGLATPRQAEGQNNKFVPLPPAGYEHPVGSYRDVAQLPQNRLPFMTPIVEKTESSIAPVTVKEEKDYFNSKTPSKNAVAEESIADVEEDLLGSPIEEKIGKLEVDDAKIPQPDLPRPAKKTTDNVGSKRGNLMRSAAPANEEIPKGPIINDTLCNPIDDHIRKTVFEHLRPPLSSYDGFSESDEKNGKGSEIRKFIKAQGKTTKGNSDKTSSSQLTGPVLQFEGSEREYTVKRELGQGAFAPVYLAQASSPEDDDDQQDENGPAVMGKGKFGIERRQLEAIKMEDPPSAWEFYIMRQAKRRLGVSRAAESVVHAYEMHLFADEGYLVEEYRDQGTLLDLVNLAKADAPAGGVMDEAVVMFFTVELLRTVEGLHERGILHGDLKADNCLVRFDPVQGPSSSSSSYTGVATGSGSSSSSGSSSAGEWTPHYNRDGTGGWNAKGLALIDFGRGIDMKVFPPDVQFVADWKAGPQDCAEMRDMRPWTYQIDYHGIAGVVHSMLFGKYIDTLAAPEQRGVSLGSGATRTYRLREPFKRYWNTEIWTALFDLLLNPLHHVQAEEGAKLPVLRGMRGVRAQMEDWLEANAERGIGLKNHLRRLEEKCRERRR
ncbi:hypothetical protein L228DRAFT_239401 [Xylona heveae TC161]|uniref:Uncharacterized protein n=1 Tax=Xylona heveae (strain CBS 132557 / TC161) TaxID=1328760 RepID=A0A165GPG7_XYLHT|nr:hypothetical protein L228DRAFT_239401 [Xylona heveae TC161]KZF22435.1 hypothetical protein L228DRAFT_239401 [Xylona heveae TC161]